MYTEAPVTARGVPHNITPGIHSCCDQYLEAIETLRKHAGREDAPTVDSFTCLSFSPWSQALAPVIEATADLSMRLCVRDTGLLSVQSGKAYLPDSTPEEEALVREPLFRRPCQASVSDNPFATSYEHVDSFFNLANSLVLVARCVAMESVDLRGPRPPTQYLMEQIENWVNGTYGCVISCTAFCADACLMLSLMYPQTFGVGECTVLPAWAEAVAAVQRRLKEQEEAGIPQDGCLFERLDLPDELVEQGRTWWQAFVRDKNAVWRNGPLGELLDLLHEHNGSHDVSRERYAQVRDCLERSVQAAWLVASPDGTTPPPAGHPASEASSHGVCVGQSSIPCLWATRSEECRSEAASWASSRTSSAKCALWPWAPISRRHVPGRAQRRWLVLAGEQCGRHPGRKGPGAQCQEHFTSAQVPLEHSRHDPESCVSIVLTVFCVLNVALRCKPRVRCSASHALLSVLLTLHLVAVCRQPMSPRLGLATTSWRVASCNAKRGTRTPNYSRLFLPRSENHSARHAVRVANTVSRTNNASRWQSASETSCMKSVTRWRRSARWRRRRAPGSGRRVGGCWCDTNPCDLVY